MKKILFISIFAMILFASCKKDHTCTCTVTSTNPSQINESTTTTLYKKVKKNEVRKDCVSKTHKDSHSPSSTIKSECKLK